MAREQDKVQEEFLVPGAVLLEQLEHPELDIKPAGQAEGGHQALHAPGLGAGAQPEDKRGIRNYHISQFDIEFWLGQELNESQNLCLSVLNSLLLKISLHLY